MTKAPESLYVEISQHPDEWTGTAEQVTEFDTEYTRADTLPALLAAEREKALREAAEIAFEADDCYLARSGILALIDADVPAQPKPDAVRAVGLGNRCPSMVCAGCG